MYSYSSVTVTIITVTIHHTKQHPEISLPNYLLGWVNYPSRMAGRLGSKLRMQQFLDKPTSSNPITVSPGRKVNALDPYQTLNPKLQV